MSGLIFVAQINLLLLELERSSSISM